MQGSRAKAAISLAILIVGLALTVAALPTASPADYDTGLIVDFGDYETIYSSQDGEKSPGEALEALCSEKDFDLVRDGNNILSIDGRSGENGSAWRLFVVEKGATGWSEPPTDGIRLSDYSAVCYGLVEDGGQPSPAVDSTGEPVYGYDSPSRIVSLAPSCSETICAAGAMDLIVGTDRYSNYPSEIEERRASGEIAEVGGFTNPSFEAILQLDPDMVVCISTQSTHLKAAEKLRAAGVDVLVLDGGESIQAVMDNMHLAGVALGDPDAAREEIGTLEKQISEVRGIVESYDFKWEKRVMVALSAIKSPYASGSGTYIDDAMGELFMFNIFSGEDGWVQVNAEMIASYDPEKIIIVSSDYGATRSEYDSMLDSMSSEWKGTSAFKNGEIYLFSGDATDCASRAGPRVAQMMELMARAVHGEAFEDGVVLPKYVGDDYKDYLPITGEGFRWIGEQQGR